MRCGAIALMRIICALMLSATLSCSFVLQIAHTPGRSLSGAGSGNCRCVNAREGPKMGRQSILAAFAQEGGNKDVCPPMPGPPIRYGPHRYSDAEFAALQRRMRVLECLVGEICGAFVYSDDISMLERNTAEIGEVY